MEYTYSLMLAFYVFISFFFDVYRLGVCCCGKDAECVFDYGCVVAVWMYLMSMGVGGAHHPACLLYQMSPETL